MLIFSGRHQALITGLSGEDLADAVPASCVADRLLPRHGGGAGPSAWQLRSLQRLCGRVSGRTEVYLIAMWMTDRWQRSVSASCPSL